MKKNLLSIVFLGAIMLSFLSEGIAQNTEPLSKDKINNIIDEHYQNSNAPFNWNTTDAYTIWSAAMRSDQLLAIGYKPVGMNRFDFKQGVGDFNFNASEWENIRQDIVETTVSDVTARNPAGRTERTHLLPFGEKNQLPYFYIRVYDLETVEALMARDDIRFVEPSGYVMVDEDEGVKSGAGCDDYADASINPADLVTITDGGITAVRSWHHDNHNIPCAWANGWKGQGIEIAVMDSGVSDYHPQFGANFTSGNSSVRTMNKVNFYDGITGDDCGHGSSMSGLASGPYNSTSPSMPVGIAYQADFNAYRVAPNVLLNSSAEQNATADAYVAAADDPDIKITSMSLGNVISSGVMVTAIQYAYSKDLMMFCAAGTSTSLTSWYPVIFPAWMPETIAITGVDDAPIGSRDRCETCHDGPEVDFVTVMQRASDDSRKAVSLGNPPGPTQQLTRGYVGGSSAGTASMAGMAAVIWSANPSESRSQIYSRMAQAADYYPGRDDDFGWGVVDVCKAADPDFAAPCDPTLANSNVQIQITNIVFPATNDNFANAEWVIEIAGQKWLFEIDEDGGSGAPSLYHDPDGCGSMPMIVNLGSTACGQSSISVYTEIHEDDGAATDCDYGPGIFDGLDDDYSDQTINIDFTTNTFTHNGATGNFVFTFNSTCVAASTPAVSVGGLARVCQGDTPPDVTFNFAGGTPPYSVTYNINGGGNITLPTTGTNTSVTTPVSTTTAGTYTYAVTQVTDALGCSTQPGSYTIEVVANCVLEVAPKIYLQGPLDMSGAAPLMNADLAGMLPPMDPYGLATPMGATALSVTSGPDQIVDWVMVELRDGATNTAVLETVAALVQRDGDVVSATDGMSPVGIPYSTSGNYHIAVHHRNHLAVMTDTPVPLLPAQL